MSEAYAGRYRPVAPLPTIGGVERELAVDNVADHRVAAAKVLAGDRAPSVAQALRGVQACRHASLAPVLDVVLGEAGEVIHIEAQSDGPLLSAAVHVPQSHALLIGADIADALAALHGAGFTHGGLVPDAVVLDASGRPIVMGAGLAGARAIIEGRPQGSPQQDVHALGSLLYLLVTSQEPAYPPVPPSSLEPTLTPALNGLILALLSDDAHRPPPPAGPVGERLRAMAGVDLPATIAPPEPTRPPLPTAPRRGISDAALAAIVGGIALVAIVLAVAAISGGDLLNDREDDNSIPTFTLPEPDELTLTVTDEELPLPDVLPEETVFTDTFEVFTDEMFTDPLPEDTFVDPALTDNGAETDIITLTG